MSHFAAMKTQIIDRTSLVKRLEISRTALPRSVYVLILACE